MGESIFAVVSSVYVQFYLANSTLLMCSLLTVGRTVDEAAILYSMLENACQSQLLAEAAAANGLPKKIIKDDAAKFTADAAQNPVSEINIQTQVHENMYADNLQHNFYTEFQPEFDLLVEETNGRFLQ